MHINEQLAWFQVSCLPDVGEGRPLVLAVVWPWAPTFPEQKGAKQDLSGLIHSGFPSLKNLYIEFTVFSGSLFGYDIFVISVNVNLHVNVNVKISETEKYD